MLAMARLRKRKYGAFCQFGMSVADADAEMQERGDARRVLGDQEF